MDGAVIMKEVSQRIAMHLEIAIAQVVVEMIAVIQVRQNVKVNYFNMRKVLCINVNLLYQNIIN